MKLLPLTCALLTSMGFAVGHAQSPAPGPRPFSIERLDPALDAIVSPDAKLELLGERFGLTEGPVWVPEGQSGYLLLSDLIENVIYKRDAAGKVTVFLDKAGYSGADLQNAGTQTKRGRAAVLMIGPNGETLDAQGRLIWCASNDGTVLRLEKDGTRTVLADKFEGKRFNGPNDVVSVSNGAIIFTDSDFGLRGGRLSPLKQLSFNGVWWVKDHVTKLLISEKDLGGFPTGIALSPDEHFLYLTSSFKKIMRYELRPDGTLGKSMVFAEGGSGIVDGMRTDLKGDLLSTGGAGPGEIRVTSVGGKHLGTIHLPIFDSEPQQQICATNIAFGDSDGKGLYITACEALYRIRLNTPGVRPGVAR
jgi:gluconolactonase